LKPLHCAIDSLVYFYIIKSFLNMITRNEANSRGFYFKTFQKQIQCTKMFPLCQGWTTLFDSRATLETKLVYASQYKNPIDLFDLIFKRKWVFGCPFSKRKHFKRHFKCLINLKKCSRATLRCLAGRMWPEGRTLPRPALCRCLKTGWILLYFNSTFTIQVINSSDISFSL